MQLAVVAAESDDVSMIRDSIVRLLGEEPLKRVRRHRFNTPSFDPEFHAALAELGHLRIIVPEAAGGLGLSTAAFCAAAAELGKALAAEPFIPAACAAALLPEAMREDVLSARATLAIAWQSRIDDLDHTGGVTAEGDLISGTKRWVYGGCDATLLLVTAPERCFVVETAAPGVTLTRTTLPDGSTVADVSFDRARACVIERSAQGAILTATLGVAAYQTGLAAAALERTIEYLKVRRQFGSPIASFQAVQHRLVDLYVQVALAGASVAEAGADPMPATVSRAKARASGAASLVTRQAIQLHGAIGYTDEFDIGLYLGKAITLNTHFGSTAAHRRRYALLRLDETA